MNRKWVIGCAGAFGVIMVTLIALFYFVIYRPASAVLDDLDQMAELTPMNEEIRNTASFSPPPSEEVTEEQYLRFSRVQDAMRNELGSDYDFLRERALILMGLFELEGGGTEVKRVGVKEGILSLDGLGPVLIRAKQIQVEAMNRNQFSVEEYRWVRENYFQAMGFSRFDVYFEEIVEGFKTGDVNIEEEPEYPPQPAVNRDRASMYSGSSGKWLPFLVFGL